MMRIFKFIRLLTTLVTLTSLVACVSSRAQHSAKVFLTGVNLLYGPISQAELFTEFPAWQKNYEAYTPDSALVNSLSRRADDGLRTEIFLGTWCADSRREVPRFLKIIDRSRFVAADSVFLWAVDRNKELDNGLTQERNIRRVATIIIFSHGAELGRIIERPRSETLEQDILTILNQNQDNAGYSRD